MNLGHLYNFFFLKKSPETSILHFHTEFAFMSAGEVKGCAKRVNLRYQWRCAGKEANMHSWKAESHTGFEFDNAVYG